MLWDGLDDLRGYLRDAILPELKYGPDVPSLPPPGHKSHRNTLSTRFKKYRHLAAVHYLGSSFDEMVNEWIIEHVPKKSIGFRDGDRSTGEVLTVPSARKFKISTALLAPVTDFSRLCAWVDYFPLQTIQRVLHIVFPQTKDWGFSSDVKANNDWDIYREFYFTDIRNLPSSQTRSNSVVVVCQPPWVLSDEDIWQFTEVKGLPTDNTSMRAKERLWAKLWDSCVRKQSAYFIVTSYQYWIFGVFSRGYTNAFISPPLNARSRDPTILHAMLYWLASALAIEDGYAAPGVPEPVDFVMGDIVVPPSDAGDDLSTVVDSLSSWTGRSEEPGSSAHAAEVAPLVSEKGIPGDTLDTVPTQYVRPRNPVAIRRMIERWRQSLPGCAGSDVQPSYAQILDAVYTDPWSGDGASSGTISSDDHTEVGERRGHWLTHA